MEKCKSIILVVPYFLHDAREVCKVDLLFERLIWSLGGDDDIVDHIAHFHGELSRFVDIWCIGWVGFSLLSPLLSLLVPLRLVLHILI